jgi:non-ribosomal peptide synthetase component F
VLPKRVSVEGMIGFFVNTLVFRNDLSEDPTFREFMTRVDESVRRSVEHSDLTFDKIVDAVQPPRDPSRNPLFQVNFRSPKAPLPEPHIEGLEISIPDYRDNGTAKFDLAFELQTQDGEGSYFEYASDLFEERTIHQMTLDYESMLRDLVTNPDTSLSRLSSVAGIRKRVRDKYGR